MNVAVEAIDRFINFTLHFMVTLFEIRFVWSPPPMGSTTCPVTLKLLLATSRRTRETNLGWRADSIGHTVLRGWILQRDDFVYSSRSCTSFEVPFLDLEDSTSRWWMRFAVTSFFAICVSCCLVTANLLVMCGTRCVGALFMNIFMNSPLVSKQF